MKLDDENNTNKDFNHDKTFIRLTEEDKVYSKKYTQNEDMLKKITSHIQKIKKGQ